MAEKRKPGRPEKYDSVIAKKRAIALGKSKRKRISIGKAYDEWSLRKDQLGLKTNEEFAMFLLHGFPWNEDSSSEIPDTPPFHTLTTKKTPIQSTASSTPVVLHTSVAAASPGMSSISSLNTDTHLTTGGNSCDSSQKSQSVHEDPKDISYVPSEEELDGDTEYDSDESDVEFEKEMRHLGIDPGCITTGSDGVLNIPASVEMADSERGTVLYDKIIDPLEACHQICGLAYMSSLKRLSELQAPKECQRCHKKVEVKEKRRGTAVALSWVCAGGHKIIERWSQPRIRQVNLGDLSQSIAVILSGNNYQKCALMSTFINCGFVNESTHYSIQSQYTIPAINNYWLSIQDDALKEVDMEALTVMGDGRNDSPGHSAQYATYTFMDYESTKVLALNTVDKRETSGISTNMEKLGFQRCLAELRRKNAKIKEVITDEHLQISALMKKEVEITHSYDIWHVGKNFSRKVNEAGQKKDCEPLKKWVGDLKTHLWHTAENCDKNPDTFLNLWRGMLHHVTNKHSWDYGRQTCSHGNLEEERDKEWLLPDSEAYRQLVKVVLDERLLRKIPHLINFRHTGKLETFHELVLMYAAKRFSYTPPSYKARCQLAAIDWNKHLHLPQAMTKDGRLRYRKVWSKHGRRWQIVPQKVAKPYNYIDDIRRDVFERRLTDGLPIRRQRDMEDDDPRRLSSTIAPESAPSQEFLLATQIHRY